MEQKNIKNHKWYILFRLYLILFSWTWVLGVGYSRVRIANGHEDPAFGRYLLLMSLPAFLMMVNVGVFPSAYSILGSYKRSPFPKEEPVYVEELCGGTIGYIKGYFSFWVYPSGLGISIFGWRVFIPISAFQNIDETIPRFRFALTHKHDEVRDPIFFRSHALYFHLKKRFDEYREESKRDSTAGN